MELPSIVPFLENKTVLVTGATGFLAKILVEKILRIQPNVKKLFLLLRAADTKSATQRLQNEVTGMELFRVLREKWGESFNSFISDKVTVIPGDISSEDLGVKDPNLMQEMLKEVDLLVNLAATTNFDERYDVALGINTMGAKHVLDFAKKCPKIKMLLHVSTAYVCGERKGLIQENPFSMGETLNGVSGLDVFAEKKLADENLVELQSKEVADQTITSAMKELGIQRAKMYGWPNTYVFTKAMGEMLIAQLKENIPVVILRPTIITSTYKEPFPGWVEGVRTIDSLAVAYGKGRLTCFIGDPDSTIDAIPADMVVNSIIAAMAAHCSEPCHIIYQVGSSLRNPLKYKAVQDYGLCHFTKHPWINKDGKPVKVGKLTVFSTMASFQRYMAYRYILPLKGLKLAAFCHIFKEKYSNLNRKIESVMRLIELYKPYLFFHGIFDDTNTEKLRMAVRETGAEEDAFYFDPRCIDWEDYFVNTHLPGLVQHVLK